MSSTTHQDSGESNDECHNNFAEDVDWEFLKRLVLFIIEKLQNIYHEQIIKLHKGPSI